MGKPYLIKIGLLGSVGRFDAPDFRAYSRDQQVVCRTDRGLEVGNVMCNLDTHFDDPQNANASTEPDGKLLRALTADDQMLLSRLHKHRDRAFQACTDLIIEKKIEATLVDVEHLFDGQSVFFYFLGDVPKEIESLTEALGETYDTKVRFRKFTESLLNGCGPDCGTKESKCGSGGCGSCGLSGRCGS